MPTFPTIDSLVAAINAEIIANGAEEITGPIMNEILNGCIYYLRKTPLNWNEAATYSAGGSIVINDEFVGVVILMGATAFSSLILNDNFYNEYMIINLTGSNVPLGTPPTVYYNLSGQPIDYVPANTALNIFKATSGLWVQANNAGGGGGNTQKQPLTYKVGTTSGAPTAGTNTWTNSSFANSWVTLFIGNQLVPMADQGDGLPYVTKLLSSTILTINNYIWNTDDSLSYILITP